MAWAALLAWAAAPAWGSQVLELEARAIVPGARVLLQDLVRAGTALPDGWGTRSVADAPPARETRALPLTEVAQMMSGYDDMRDVVLRGRPVIQVSVKHRSVELARIQQAVDQYVQTHSAWKGRRFEVTGDNVDMPRVPEGKLEVAVVALREGPESGRIAAEIRAVVDGVSCGEKSSSVELAEMRPFWATTRPLARGEAVPADALEMRWIAERDASRYYPADRSVAGMELRRSVPAGQLLAAGMLAQPLYAKRGEIVQVVSRRGGMTVSLRARALADGRRNDRILCVNEQSGRRMQALLVRPRAAYLDEEPGAPQI